MKKKKGEGRREKEEVRRKKEEGRRKKRKPPPNWCQREEPSFTCKGAPWPHGARIIEGDLLLLDMAFTFAPSLLSLSL